MLLRQKINYLDIILKIILATHFLTLFHVNAASCAIGYFNNNDVCTQWATSWYTCTNATEWASCYNRILNSSTKLWEFCPYGQFFSPQISKCINWDGSWSEEWGYQTECYAWPTGMMFDLTQLKWVSSCTSSQVFIQDPLLRNIPIWRDTVYYVDAGSIQPIELGTK